MESIVRDIVMDNFLSSDFFSDNQYGFIKGRSTVIQLLKIMDEWTYNLDQGIQIDVVYTVLTLRRHSIKFHIKALSVNLRHII